MTNHHHNKKHNNNKHKKEDSSSLNSFFMYGGTSGDKYQIQWFSDFARLYVNDGNEYVYVGYEIDLSHCVDGKDRIKTVKTELSYM